MSAASSAIASDWAIEISADGMHAYLCLRSKQASPPHAVDEIFSALKTAGVVVTEEVSGRASEFIALAKVKGSTPDPFVIAQGRPAEIGRDEELAWDERFQLLAGDWQGESPENIYDLESVVIVKERDALGSISPLVPATGGVDVRGRALKPSRQPRPLELDDTLQRDPENPARIISNAPGRLTRSDRVLGVRPLQIIEGDITSATGNVDAPTAIHVKGNISDGSRVNAGGSIAVEGTIEAAQILAGAGGNVVVRRGIVGRNSGCVTAGANIVAKFCSDVALCTGADLKVGLQLMNCRAHVQGQLLADYASVIGGHVEVQRGARVAVLGSDAAIPTRIFVGIDPERLRQAAEIDAHLQPIRERVEKTREKIKPLLDNMRRLNPTQREQATELMFQADEAAAHVTAEEARRDALLQIPKADGPARCVVANMVYPKVRISFGRRVTTIQKELHGPIIIEERKVKNVTELVAVHPTTGALQILSSQVISIPDLISEYEPIRSISSSTTPSEGVRPSSDPTQTA